MRGWLNKHPRASGMLFFFGWVAFTGFAAPPFLYFLSVWFKWWLP